MPADQKARNLASGFYGSPSVGSSFLLDPRGLCIENNISATKKAPIPNWRCAGAARCAFPLKCGQITKTKAVNLMALGALEPSPSITEQASRWQWLLYTMVHHMKVPRRIVAIEIISRILREKTRLSETRFSPLLAISSALVMSEFESEHIRKIVIPSGNFSNTNTTGH